MTVAGLLLTGGGSRRLGIDKLSLPTAGGGTVAEHTARTLAAVARPALEVGDGLTPLPSVSDDTRDGPLGAITRGHRALDASDAPATLVVAGDLPRLTPATLERIAGHAPAAEAVVPLVGGVPQVLCARYSRSFLDAAAAAYDRGERSLRRLLDGSDVTFLDEGWWTGYVDGAAVFDDLDTVEDARRLLDLGVLASHAADALAKRNRLLDDLSARAGAELTDVAALAVAISRIPYGRPSDLSPHGVVADWRGTCSTKHLLLQALAPLCEPGAAVELVHRVYQLSRADADARWGPAVAATVPPEGLVDVHTYGRLSALTVDVTFPIAPWDGRTPLPLACGPGDDIPAGDDLLAEKADLVARHCDPTVREPFIAAIGRHYEVDPTALVETDSPTRWLR